MQEDDAVGDVAGEAHLVSDDEHRAPFVGERAHDPEDLADEFGVERRSRFVEQHHSWPHRQRARNCGALLLPAGEMGGIEVRLVVDADFVEQRIRFLDALGAWPLLHMDRRLDEILEDRHVRPEVEALKHHAEFGADAVDLAAIGGN